MRDKECDVSHLLTTAGAGPHHGLSPASRWMEFGPPVLSFSASTATVSSAEPCMRELLSRVEISVFLTGIFLPAQRFRYGSLWAAVTLNCLRHHPWPVGVNGGSKCSRCWGPTRGGLPLAVIRGRLLSLPASHSPQSKEAEIARHATVVHDTSGILGVFFHVFSKELVP